MGNPRDFPSHNPVSDMAKARDTVDSVNARSMPQFYSINCGIACRQLKYSFPLVHNPCSYPKSSVNGLLHSLMNVSFSL